MISNVGGFAGSVFPIFAILYQYYNQAYGDIENVKKSFNIRKNKTGPPPSKLKVDCTIS